MKVVTLLSGGVESLVVAALLDKADLPHRYAFFVDYGQNVAAQERRASRAIARAYGMFFEEVSLKLPFLADCSMVNGTVMIGSLAEHLFEVEDDGNEVEPDEDSRSHVVPYRNLWILSLAAAFAETVGAEEVWTGFDHVPGLDTATKDKSPEFVSRVNLTFGAAGDAPPEVVAPLQGNDKLATIKVGEELGVDWGLAWSCYNNLGDKHCGICIQCATRKAVFESLGRPDPTEYHRLRYIRRRLGVE